MTCMIIASNSKIHTLIIVDLFKDSKTVSLSEKLKKYFLNVVLVKSRNEALKLCEIIKPKTIAPIPHSIIPGKNKVLNA